MCSPWIIRSCTHADQSPSALFKYPLALKIDTILDAEFKGTNLCSIKYRLTGVYASRLELVEARISRIECLRLTVGLIDTVKRGLRLDSREGTDVDRS